MARVLIVVVMTLPLWAGGGLIAWQVLFRLRPALRQARTATEEDEHHG